MSNQTDDHISARLAEAFDGAVDLYQTTWTPGVSEPEIVIEGKAHTLTEVCRLVESYDDKLPNIVLDRLWYYLDDTRRLLKEDLGRNRTYAAGGRCLRKLMEDRTNEYQLKEELRRS